MDSRRKKLTILGLCISMVFLVFTYLVIWVGDSYEDVMISKSKSQYKETDTGIYIGNIIDEKLDGKGTIQYFIGDTFSGQFVSGMKNGEGNYVYADGSKYQGNYENGKRNGSGTFKFKDGSIYEGQWLNDCMNGEGKYTFSNGDALNGTFEKNVFQKGTYKYTNSKGSFVISLKGRKASGQVEAHLKNGDTYAGKLTKGKFSGKCKITYKNGDVYQGNVSANLKDGKGTYKWAEDGDYYSGQWKKDKMGGTGEYHYSSSKFPYLKGTFVSNKPSGSCTYFKSQKTKYTTYWEKGSCTKITK